MLRGFKNAANGYNEQLSLQWLKYWHWRSSYLIPYFYIYIPILNLKGYDDGVGKCSLVSMTLTNNNERVQYSWWTMTRSRIATVRRLGSEKEKRKFFTNVGIRIKKSPVFFNPFMYKKIFWRCIISFSWFVLYHILALWSVMRLSFTQKDILVCGTNACIFWVLMEKINTTLIKIKFKNIFLIYKICISYLKT